MLKIIGIGNALVDIMTSLEEDEFLEINELPKGSMQLVEAEKSAELLKAAAKLKKQQVSGGATANTIRSLAKLGVETGFIGKVGNDELGNFYEKELTDYGVKPRMMRADIPTGTALALVSKDGERTFATHLGAAISLIPEDLKDEDFEDYNILYLEGYLVQNHDLLTRAAEISKKKNLQLAIDLASYNIVSAEKEFLKPFIRDHVDILFANEEEAESFFPGKSPEEAVIAFAEMVDTAIVKIGPRGALIHRGDQKVLVEGRPAQCLDTTGAGDNFAAGFLYGLSEGLDLKHAGDIANLLGANVIEVVGTSMDDVRWGSIKNEIRKIQNNP
ncbi:MAG: adenosine kinase [Bacteroidota bacterium]|nr:adenosine kinase [Bacteroidota bacterium]